MNGTHGILPSAPPRARAKHIFVFAKIKNDMRRHQKMARRQPLVTVNRAGDRTHLNTGDVLPEFAKWWCVVSPANSCAIRARSAPLLAKLYAPTQLLHSV